MSTKKKVEEAPVITDTMIDREAKSMKDVLAAQPKVKVMIAPDKKEPMFRCTINGYTLTFPKGQLIDVPESVALLIEQSNITAYQASMQEQKLVNGINL